MAYNNPVLSELLGSLVSRLDNLFSSPAPPSEPYPSIEKSLVLRANNQNIQDKEVNKVVKTDKDPELLKEEDIYKDMLPGIEYLSKKKKIDISYSTFLISITNLPIPLPPNILRNLLSICGKIESIDYIKNIDLNPFNQNFVLVSVRSIFTIISIKLILNIITFNFNGIKHKLKVNEDDFTKQLILNENKRLNTNMTNIGKQIDKIVKYFIKFNIEYNDKLIHKIEDDIEYSRECMELLVYIEKDKINPNHTTVVKFLSTIKAIIDQINYNLKDNFICIDICIENPKFICNKTIQGEHKHNRIIVRSISKIPMSIGLSLEDNMRDLFNSKLDSFILKKHGILEHEIFEWLSKVFNKHFSKNMESVIIRIIEDIKNGIHPIDLIHNVKLLFKRDSDIFVFCLWRRIRFEINYTIELYN